MYVVNENIFNSEQCLKFNSRNVLKNDDIYVDIVMNHIHI